VSRYDPERWGTTRTRVACRTKTASTVLAVFVPVRPPPREGWGYRGGSIRPGLRCYRCIAGGSTAYWTRRR
jgi:hypothetical protein